MTRAIIRNIHTDDKGRAVVLMVVDSTPGDLRAALGNGPAAIELMTKAHIAQPTAAQSEKGGQLCKWLHARCREQMFQRFLGVRYGRNATTPEIALDAVKDLLQFASSARLDNDPDLSMRFRAEIIQEYSKWQNIRR